MMAFIEELLDWEIASYAVTVFAMPFAAAVFLIDRRKNWENEQEETYLLLSDDYNDFLKMAMEQNDLLLWINYHDDGLNEEQISRKIILFQILISFFERAYLLAYEENMKGNELRRWKSWEDFMEEWCEREDFASRLDYLLKGEDAEFSAFIKGIAKNVKPSRLPHKSVI